MNNSYKQSGYIALISAIIISALLLIIISTASFSSYFVRFNILDSEYKKISTGLAEACVETAILEIAENSPILPGTTVNVGGGSKTCKICEVDTDMMQPNKKTILARAVYNKAFTNFEVRVSTTTNDVVVDSWIETPTSPAGCILP